MKGRSEFYASEGILAPTAMILRRDLGALFSQPGAKFKGGDHRRSAPFRDSQSITHMIAVTMGHNDIFGRDLLGFQGRFWITGQKWIDCNTGVFKFQVNRCVSKEGGFHKPHLS